MKPILFCLSLFIAGSACADELADANALFAKKAYPEALQKYTKLANAGNVEAQQHLGEMYWYGEAGAVDEAKAEAWFQKAAAKGNKVAIASLDVMKQRVQRRADIDYWVSKYDSYEFRSGEYRCPAPRFPAVSKQNDEIDRVGSKMQDWQDCHNRFVKHLNESTPFTKLIPADISKLMNKDEMERAKAHLEQVQANVTEDAKVSAKLVLADFAVWRSATEAYVKQNNEIVRNLPSPERQSDTESRKSAK
ncbi:tetratricopeptide repeat protein [Massilia horti]|uniref:Sel1 repeat family protein n=1 Tax=Massilia horti TaxID=2562153 RepID=A0A4Y9T556_9BURK|nr:sel1 repeat family protein [Massilia horti]TFW33553.1 sel1 repeat family protein [Massilia horti]